MSVAIEYISRSLVEFVGYVTNLVGGSSGKVIVLGVAQLAEFCGIV